MSRQAPEALGVLRHRARRVLQRTFDLSEGILQCLSGISSVGCEKGFHTQGTACILAAPARDVDEEADRECCSEVSGWKPGGAPPEGLKKFVLIAVPHTANIDGFWLNAFAWYYGVRIQWLAKHTIFKWPYGPILKLLGGIPRRTGGHRRDRRSGR